MVTFDQNFAMDERLSSQEVVAHLQPKHTAEIAEI